MLTSISGFLVGWSIGSHFVYDDGVFTIALKGSVDCFAVRRHDSWKKEDCVQPLECDSLTFRREVVIVGKCSAG